MKRLIATFLALTLILSCSAFAAGDTFNAGLTFGEDSNGNMTVTVQDSSILASQKPTLSIPCDYQKAYVTYDGKSVSSSLKNGAITFVVAAGGTYTIIEGVDPNPPAADPDPTPTPTPTPDPDPVPTPRPESKPDTSDKTDDEVTSDFTDVTIGGETSSDTQTSVSAKVEIEADSGSAQVTLDTEKLQESLAQQVIDTPASGSESAPASEPVTVTIDLTEAEAPVKSVTVDSESVAMISEAAADPDNAVVGLTVSMESGEITLNDQVLLKASNANEPLVVEISTPEVETLTQEQQDVVKDMPVVEINVMVGETRLTDLGEGRIRVALPYTPEVNEDLSNLVVWRVEDDGTLVPISCVYENGKVIFVLDHLSYYVIVNFPFTDVPTTWYYGDVAYVWSNSLMNGTGSSSFSPNATTSRGMIVTILWRLEGQPAAGSCTFTDVKAGSYYEQAIAWAAENGIVNGINANSFNPDGTITREQFATILYRYAKEYKGYDVSVGEDTNILSYADAFSISEYAFPALQWACGAGLMNGSDGALMPGGSATRAQAAALLHRFCENVK